LLEDFRVARVTLPTPAGESVLECAIRVVAADSLEARFLPAQLSGIPIEQGTLCRVFCEAGLSTLSIQARVESMTDARLLRLRIEGGSSHGDTRLHFRVDTRIALRFWPIDAVPPAMAEMLDVNLSSGGMRFTSASALELGARLVVEIGLPGKIPKMVQGIGRVVGVWQKAGQGHEVVVQFIEMSPAHLNRLTEYCLGLKFRHMCSRVELLGSLLKPGLPEEKGKG